MTHRFRRASLLSVLATVVALVGAAPADAAGWSTASRDRYLDSAAPSAPVVAAEGQSAAAAGPAHRTAPPLAKSPAALDAACGPGMVGIRSSAGIYCRHQALDPAAPRTVHAASRSVAPKCHGNGVNGPRVHLIYGYLEGRQNRAGILSPRILKEWVPALEGNFRLTSKEQGREIGVRYHAPGCKLSVAVVEFPAIVGDKDISFSQQYTQVLNTLFDEGYGGVDKRPLLWLDAPAAHDSQAGGPCGVAVFAAPRFLPVTGDNPTPANANSFGNMQGNHSIAISFRNQSRQIDHRMMTRGGGRSECWGGYTEVHELLHTLGAVQITAPNSDGAGHCSDGFDIMCDENQVKVRTRCNSPVKLLDCGMDDYFAMRPAAGSYLSTHWNTANSRFLGDAIGIDAIPAPLPPI